MMSQDARDRLRTASEVFHKPVDAQERAHCRLDLHKTQRGTTVPYVSWHDIEAAGVALKPNRTPVFMEPSE